MSRRCRRSMFVKRSLMEVGSAVNFKLPIYNRNELENNVLLNAPSSSSLIRTTLLQTETLENDIGMDLCNNSPSGLSFTSNSPKTLALNYPTTPAKQLSLTEQLKLWAITTNVNHKQLSSLLSVLKSFHPELPKSSKTLLKTVRKLNYTPMQSADNSRGKFCYFGIENGIRHQLKISPFAVAIFEGNNKPGSLNQFLDNFITEKINSLSSTGFVYQGVKITVSLKYMICDAPARSFLKNIKPHNSYFACEKCNVKGLRMQNRILYPCNSNIEIRTDEGFLNQVHKEHHKGLSPLTKIPHFGMVSGFILDYMHMSCLGTMRRLIQYWFKPSWKCCISLSLRTEASF
ncbi:hypothetical protein PPYR_07334 [Photinus pyralis]|uniref:Uncharacterized protein n=1 Tax=Photinus pyralis TaxID=7054 RepID=A0A5N4AQ47_PHOPY|nr:hypothetical protein PPYR_07334 [Photinus pyralis]